MRLYTHLELKASNSKMTSFAHRLSIGIHIKHLLRNEFKQKIVKQRIFSLFRLQRRGLRNIFKAEHLSINYWKKIYPCPSNWVVKLSLWYQLIEVTQSLVLWKSFFFNLSRLSAVLGITSLPILRIFLCRPYQNVGNFTENRCDGWAVCLYIHLQHQSACIQKWHCVMFQGEKYFLYFERIFAKLEQWKIKRCPFPW